MDLTDINKAAVKIVQGINILDKISWPLQLEREFLKKLTQGKKPVLKFQYQKFDLSEQRHALKRLLIGLSKEEPLQVYTTSTIESYIDAINLIHHAGHPTFQDLSIKVYGRPSHLLFGSRYSHLETAQKFIQSFQDYEHPYLPDSNTSFTADQIGKYLKRESQKVFGPKSPKIIKTNQIVAKATAGKSAIRLRKNAEFSAYDFDQLLVHELMTHSLTAINGSQQKNLLLLSMGSPRTTKTQEGLATFSETITGSLDLKRLVRISLRVVAIDMALNGANFYDLFDFFLKNGQDIKESYLSASRIFRGGYPTRGPVFTKDGVYLEGLIRVHSFFRWAFRTRNLHLVHLLFSGRMDINDVFLLKPAFDSKVIEPPSFLPEWYRQTDLLAGKMALSLILNGIDLDSVTTHYSTKLVTKLAA